jgi:peptide/nickel transport system substrate-binding protein
LHGAGWRDTDGDGILDKNGQPLEFTILLNMGNQERLKSAEIIQRQLGEIGIRVKLRVMEWASFINEYIDKKRFEAVILGWSTGPEPDQYDIWHSSKTAPKELNFISYKNKEVDEVLEKARRTFNQEERKRYYFRFQEILAEDQPYTFLFIPYALPAINARFRGIQPAPAGITYNFIHWYVPTREQRYLR